MMDQPETAGGRTPPPCHGAGACIKNTALSTYALADRPLLVALGVEPDPGQTALPPPGVGSAISRKYETVEDIEKEEKS